MNGHLVIIPCGKAKAAAPEPAAALYTGGYFRACLAYARTLTDDDHIRILSGKHGLLRLTDVVAPYEQRIDKPGAVPADVVLAQAIVRGLRGCRPVTALTGKAYGRVVRRVWPHAVFPLDGVPNGMGGRLAWLAGAVA